MQQFFTEFFSLEQPGLLLQNRAKATKHGIRATLDEALQSAASTTQK